MTGTAQKCGPHVVRSIFVHAEEVTIACPLCGKILKESFSRSEPTGTFFPDSIACACGRYTYHHSVR